MNENPTEVEDIESTLMLLCQGDKGDNLLNSFLKTITKVEIKHKTKLSTSKTKQKQNTRMTWCTNTNVNKLTVKHRTYIGKLHEGFQNA